jgi:hypothetical protein
MDMEYGLLLPFLFLAGWFAGDVIIMTRRRQ